MKKPREAVHYSNQRHGMETYQATSEKHGDGTFFFTDCGNRMYSIRNDWETYHGCICPKCGKILYIRGSREANEYLNRRKY